MYCLRWKRPNKSEWHLLFQDWNDQCLHSKCGSRVDFFAEFSHLDLTTNNAQIACCKSWLSLITLNATLQRRVSKLTLIFDTTLPWRCRSEMYKIEFCSATCVCVWVFITGIPSKIPSIPPEVVIYFPWLFKNWL